MKEYAKRPTEDLWPPSWFGLRFTNCIEWIRYYIDQIVHWCLLTAIRFYKEVASPRPLAENSSFSIHVSWDLRWGWLYSGVSGCWPISCHICHICHIQFCTLLLYVNCKPIRLVLKVSVVRVHWISPWFRQTFACCCKSVRNGNILESWADAILESFRI